MNGFEFQYIWKSRGGNRTFAPADFGFLCKVQAQQARESLSSAGGPVEAVLSFDFV